MDWLALLHFACIIPTLGLIFGTSCCCEVSTECARCVSNGYPLCGTSGGNSSVTFEGIANKNCTDCDNLNRTISFPGRCGGTATVGTVTLCGIAGRSLYLDLGVGVGGTDGNCTIGFTSTYGIQPSISFSFQSSVSNYSTTEAHCEGIGTPHTFGKSAFGGTNECDINSATCTVVI